MPDLQPYRPIEEMPGWLPMQQPKVRADLQRHGEVPGWLPMQQPEVRADLQRYGEMSDRISMHW